jgi:hypothetical protein
MDNRAVILNNVILNNVILDNVILNLFQDHFRIIPGSISGSLDDVSWRGNRALNCFLQLGFGSWHLVPGTWYLALRMVPNSGKSVPPEGGGYANPLSPVTTYKILRT